MWPLATGCYSIRKKRIKQIIKKRRETWIKQTKIVNIIEIIFTMFVCIVYLNDHCAEAKINDTKIVTSWYGRFAFGMSPRSSTFRDINDATRRTMSVCNFVRSSGEAKNVMHVVRFPKTVRKTGFHCTFFNPYLTKYGNYKCRVKDSQKINDFTEQTTNVMSHSEMCMISTYHFIMMEISYKQNVHFQHEFMWSIVLAAKLRHLKPDTIHPTPHPKILSLTDPKYIEIESFYLSCHCRLQALSN